ncbi:EamA family transporter [Agrococcus jejuensis]|uniref:EamA family transporter n=1 Tax=Agrococcus jejuensis TaxID=399736 RepID=UPI0011A5878C|nr:EamA family transporter [Agrococcus jejuensis]
MEANWRWMLVTAVAPIAWGSMYVVTHQALPADAPLWGATLRALPAAIVLLLVVRRLPTGAWWWRSAVLGVLNVGAFFLLVYVAATLLPSSVAASVMAASPIALMALAWPIARERPTARLLAGAGVGVVGVLLIVSTATGSIDARGVVASVTALAMWSLGSVLAKRWHDGTPALRLTAWQLATGAIALAPLALLVEGAPPHVDAVGVAAYAYVTIVATAVAFVCWFTGMQRLPAGAVGILALLNPATGVLLGVAVGGEHLAPLQWLGIALVVAAVAIGATRTRRRAPAPASPSAAQAS